MAYFEPRKNKQKQIVAYRAQLKVTGFKREGKTFKKLSDAKAWANKREAEIREGIQSIDEKSRSYNVAKLIDRYIEQILPGKTEKSRSKELQLAQLNFLKKEIGEYTLNNVTAAVISQVREKLKVNRKPSTVNRYMAILSHVFTIAFREWELIYTNPFKKIQMLPEPRGRVKFLTDDERILLLQTSKKIDPLLYLFIIMGLSTGARKSELLNLKWQDVDMENNSAVLQETKNDERRTIFFFGDAYAAMKERYDNRRKGFKFVFATRRYDVPVNIYNSWYRCLKKMKLKDFHIHDLRHCYATELAKNGASLNDLAELLGHKTLNMVKRYAHMTPAHAATKVREMNENLITQKPSEIKLPQS